MRASIGKRIKEARQRVGLTQAEVARRMGISRTSASIWESGGSVSQENIPRLAKVLKVTPEWLHYGVQRDAVDTEILKKCLQLAYTAKSRVDGKLNDEIMSNIIVELYTRGSQGIEIDNEKFNELLERYGVL